VLHSTPAGMVFATRLACYACPPAWCVLYLPRHVVCHTAGCLGLGGSLPLTAVMLCFPNFLHCSGCLYELDGLKPGPIKLADCTEVRGSEQSVC